MMELYHIFKLDVIILHVGPDIERDVSQSRLRMQNRFLTGRSPGDVADNMNFETKFIS